MLHECVQTGLIPTPYSVDNLRISHLLYADDLMLFSNASVQVAGNIKKFLHHFCQFTGLQVNNDKSNIFFANCDEEIKGDIATVLG